MGGFLSWVNCLDLELGLIDCLFVLIAWIHWIIIACALQVLQELILITVRVAKELSTHPKGHHLIVDLVNLNVYIQKHSDPTVYLLSMLGLLQVPTLP